MSWAAETLAGQGRQQGVGGRLGADRIEQLLNEIHADDPNRDE